MTFAKNVMVIAWTGEKAKMDMAESKSTVKKAINNCLEAPRLKDTLSSDRLVAYGEHYDTHISGMS